MQNILAVNVSKEPAEALIVEIEGKRLSVKERHTATLNNLFLSTQSSPSNLTTAEQSVEIDRSVPDQAKLPEENSFIELISGFTSEWSNSILIVPGQEYL